MPALESFPHTGDHYSNDDRQAVLTIMLLNAFIVALAALVSVVLVASAS